MNLEDLKLELSHNHSLRIEIMSKAVRCKRGSEKFMNLKAESTRLSAIGDKLVQQIKDLQNG